MPVKKRSRHTLRDFFTVAFKHKLLIVLVFTAAVLTAVTGSVVMEPVYESGAKILVKRPPEGSGNQAFSIDTAVEMLQSRYLIEQVVATIGPNRLFPGLQEPAQQSAVARFQEHLTVTPGTIIDLRFLHPDPQTGAQALNKLTELFLEHYLAVHADSQRYRFFKDQLDLMQRRLQDAQKQLGLFRSEHNISSAQKQKSLLLLQVSDLELEQSKVRGEISALETRASVFAQDSPELPDVRQNILGLQSREKKLRQQITEYQLALGRLNKAETRLSELERQVKIDEENYLLYARKTEEARIASAMEERRIIDFTVLEPALPPLAPQRPRSYGFIALAAVIGTGLALLLAFIAEYFTHTFDRPEDTETVLSVPCLATLPPPGAAPGIVQENCNRMRHVLERALAGQTARRIAFCATRPREGASHVLLETARALAAGGERVCVVDADVRHGRLHEALGVPRGPGLAEALQGTAGAEAVVHATSVPGLDVIPAGDPPPNAGALLQPETLAGLLFRPQADWVLIDCAPLDCCDDACRIAPHTDGAVLIVRAGKTRWEATASAAAALRQSGARLLGAVLNRRRMHIPGWLYNRL